MSLLPGQVSEKPIRFRCYLCQRETGIFEQQSYTNWQQKTRHSVCHSCMLDAVSNALQMKESP